MVLLVMVLVLVLVFELLMLLVSLRVLAQRHDCIQKTAWQKLGRHEARL